MISRASLPMPFLGLGQECCCVCPRRRGGKCIVASALRLRPSSRVNPFPFLNKINNRRTLGVYLAGALVSLSRRLPNTTDALYFPILLRPLDIFRCRYPLCSPVPTIRRARLPHTRARHFADPVPGLSFSSASSPST